MPLLLPASTLYSASILKLRNRSFDTRLFATQRTLPASGGGAFVMTPSAILQPIGRPCTCTLHMSSDLLSKSTDGASNVCGALALAVGQVGGRTPIQLTTCSAPFCMTV